MEFSICDDAEQVRLAQQVRYEVFSVEKAWVDPKSCPGGLELDEYDALAVHFLAVEDGVPVGTSRLLLGSKQRLPAAEHIDLATLGLQPHEAVEVSRLAIRRLNRSQDLRVFFGLTRLMWFWMMERSIKVWMAVADVSLFRLLDRLGMPAIDTAPQVHHLGSDCIPVVYDVPLSGPALKLTPTECDAGVKSFQLAADKE